jgi:hypothetical protein
MKWFLLFAFFFVILLVLLFSFGRDFGSSSASPAPVVQPTTITSTPTWSPTIEPLPVVDTRSRDIYYFLNMAIEDMERSTKFNMLEHINGASYQVVYVGLEPNNDTPTTLQVDVRCECANNADCCSSTHTFVVIMEAMDGTTYESPIITAVPTSVRNLSVSTFEHTVSQHGMTVPWIDVVSFLQGNLDGYRLWYEVTPVP